MKNSYFLSQPHQPFFTLSFINAIVFMLLFLLSYKGVVALHVDVINFHSFGLIYLFFTPAFFAFLFTTFPRFLSTAVIEKSLYIRIFSLFAISSLSFILGALFSSILYNISMLITTIAFIYSYKTLFDIYKSSSVPNKHDPFWILVGASFGIVGILLFSFTPFNTLATEVSVYLFLFLVTFSVAQRMIPFFSGCNYFKNPKFLKYTTVLLVVHVLLDALNTNISFIIDIVLAIYIGREIYRWKLPFPNQNPLLWILHIALFWIPISFVLSFISNAIEFFFQKSFLALDIHSLLIGFLLTILIGFGTRVTLGHSGNSMFVTQLTKFIFIWTQIVVLLRVVTSIVASFEMNYMILFDISATVWIVLFLLWSWQFLKVLISGKQLS